MQYTAPRPNYTEKHVAQRPCETLSYLAHPDDVTTCNKLGQCTTTDRSGERQDGTTERDGKKRYGMEHNSTTKRGEIMSDITPRPDVALRDAVRRSAHANRSCTWPHDATVRYLNRTRPNTVKPYDEAGTCLTPIRD